MNANEQDHPSTCTRCGSAALRADTIRSAFWEDGRLVVIEDIPALVCPDCHEQYFDDTTVVLLDLMRGDGFPPEKARREIVVPVFSLRDRLQRGPES
jgi:YgiT-type zinc finger domain-containing protein